MYEPRSRDESKTLVTNQPFRVKEQTDPYESFRPQGNRSKNSQSHNKQKHTNKQQSKSKKWRPKLRRRSPNDSHDRAGEQPKQLRRNPN
ncbi:hypothetical protein QL285_032635 [Trifolium repens]|jgi:hypothetical protein|nr:hypothetical protein QL285_032635 [Trifolium repens]